MCLRSLVGGRTKVLHPKSVSIFLEMQVILDNNSRSDEKWGQPPPPEPTATIVGHRLTVAGHRLTVAGRRFVVVTVTEERSSGSGLLFSTSLA
ncbi:hypothetical protein S245_043694, partial [Arachis hypogaea]